MAGVSVKRNGHPHHRNRKNPVKNGKQKNLPCGKSSIPSVPFQHSKLSPSGTGKKIPADHASSWTNCKTSFQQPESPVPGI